MSERKYLIDNRVIFDSERMSLTHSDKTVSISESETNLLLAFYKGLFKKDDLIGWVWGRKGVVVSDASYYKLINQLRNTFDKIGLPSSSVVTRPKVGVELVLSITPIKPAASRQPAAEPKEHSAEPFDETSPTNEHNKSSVAGRRDWIFLALAALLMIVGLCASLWESHPYFSAPVTHDGYYFYKVNNDKTSFEDVAAAYAELTTPVIKQNGRHIYYIRVPDTHIFVQCLNPLTVAEPKCITLKERY